MRTIKRTAQFKKDYKRETKGRYQKALKNDLVELLGLLANDMKLPARFADHALKGQWQDFRDCHVKPDLVLIYRKTEDGILYLVRIGTHTALGI